MQSSAFSVTGVGFQPTWVILLYSNLTTENVWTSGPSAGVGMAALQDSLTSPTAIRRCGIHEIWYNAGNVACGGFLGDVAMWVRQTNGSNGWAANISTFDADGFSISLIGGFTTGAGGQTIFYLAGDDDFEEVAMRNAFVPGSPSFNVGFEPTAFFGIGAGGAHGGDGGVQSQSWFDISINSICAGYFVEDDGDRELIVQYRGISDPNVILQEWWGYNIIDNGTILEDTRSAGVWFSSDFIPSRTATTFVPTFDAGGGIFQRRRSDDAVHPG